MRTFNILGVHVAEITPLTAFNQIFQWIKERQRTYVCVAPVATLVDAQRIEGYRDVINRAGMVTPDGMPVVWLLKSKGAQAVERTYGPDLMRLVCDRGRQVGLKHFFYGSTEPVMQALIAVMKRQYPGITIVGTCVPEFSTEAKDVSDTEKRLINASGADIVWVALGSPKQDFWMARNRMALNVPVLVGIGAAFDFLSGTKPQAPRFIQRCGLEWLFRLCCEPRRLWRRYLIGNTLFLYYCIRSIWQTR